LCAVAPATQVSVAVAHSRSCSMPAVGRKSLAFAVAAVVSNEWGI
jgi:hypothetical protein